MKALVLLVVATACFGQAPNTFPSNLPTIVPVSITSSGGLLSGTYTSGITVTGTTGQTCIVTITNGGGTLAAATVALTGLNAVAGGTALVVTAAGSGYTSAPTAATATTGTATSCSGTLVIATKIFTSPSITGYWFLDNLAGAFTYSLPTISTSLVGTQLCFRQYTTRAGVITLLSPASTFIDKAGAAGSSGGTLVSGGAAGDQACVAAVDTTHWFAFNLVGTWTNN